MEESLSTRSLMQTMYCCMYPCCEKMYSTKFNLKRHVETTHLNIKRYMCDVCQKLFASKQNLLEHKFIHTGDKPFICKVCGDSFRQASQLSLHKRSHLQELQTSRSEKVRDNGLTTVTQPTECSSKPASLFHAYYVVSSGSTYELPAIKDSIGEIPRLPSVFKT